MKCGTNIISPERSMYALVLQREFGIYEESMSYEVQDSVEEQT